MKLYVILLYWTSAASLLIVTTLATDLIKDPKQDLDRPKICVMERVYKMMGYTCSNLDLKTVPQNLKTGLEIFDLSFNRIRDLTRSSFARYDDIKYLYLFDNMIQSIETDTFSHLTSLEAIDLSTNGITTLPMELFRLPLLRNLHAYENNLKDLDRDLRTFEKPITAPLQYINLSGCRLSKIPDFGILPELWQLNISSNDLSDVVPQSFSPFCHLKSVDLNRTHIPLCSCQMISFYFRKHSITANSGIVCNSYSSGSDDDLLVCNDSDNVSSDDTDDFAKCAALVKTRKLNKEVKLTWMTIAAGLVGFFICFMGILYIFHRRNVRKIKDFEDVKKIKKIHSKTAVMLDDRGNEEILLKKLNSSSHV